MHELASVHLIASYCHSTEKLGCMKPHEAANILLFAIDPLVVGSGVRQSSQKG
jgi:hypothetical protein